MTLKASFARNYRAPHQITAPAASNTPAEMISDACAPAMNAPDWPTSEPNKATPSTLPVCRVALRTPAAMPERDFSTLPSSVEVSGGTSSPSPPPMTISWAQIAQ